MITLSDSDIDVLESAEIVGSGSYSAGDTVTTTQASNWATMFQTIGNV